MTTRGRDDEGLVLPIVLVLVAVVGAIVVAVAGYVTADLRYGNVVEERADRLAAADGGLRFGIEKLRNFQTLCTTQAGAGGGFTTVFPPEINGATAAVTCRRVGTGISDIQGWGVVVTGEGVPAGQPIFSTQGAGGSDNIKTFSGPVYVADPTRLDLAAKLEIDNGDLWYSSDDCDEPVTIPGAANGYLTFTPDFFRGPLCTDLAWNGGLFTPPSASTPPTSPVNAAFVDDGASCRVFSPGKYTSLPLGAHNYFKAGTYYLENVDVSLQNQSMTAGFPGGAGDSPKVNDPQCSAAQASDQAAGGAGGATFYLGGSSRFEVNNGAQLEVFRRKQAETYLSVYALGSSGAGYLASTLNFNDFVLETKSGSNNDVAIHGLVWAPLAGTSLGNITNAANGQLLGGIVVALLDTQASASASAFAIGIETNPVDVRLLLVSTATKNGHATTIRAVVQFRPDSGELAVNSWRVST